MGCIGIIKALLGFRVKQFGGVLVPFAAGYAALGAPFLGRGQPADDKGGPAGRKMYRKYKGLFRGSGQAVWVKRLAGRCAL